MAAVDGSVADCVDALRRPGDWNAAAEAVAQFSKSPDKHAELLRSGALQAMQDLLSAESTTEASVQTSQQHAMMALSQLSVHSAAQSIIVQVPKLVVALFRHVSNLSVPRLSRPAAFVLCTLASNPAICPALCGGVPIMVDLMSSFSTRPEVSEWMCSALCKMTLHPSAQASVLPVSAQIATMLVHLLHECNVFDTLDQGCRLCLALMQTLPEGQRSTAFPLATLLAVAARFTASHQTLKHFAMPSSQLLLEAASGGNHLSAELQKPFSLLEGEQSDISEEEFTGFCDVLGSAVSRAVRGHFDSAASSETPQSESSDPILWLRLLCSRCCIFGFDSLLGSGDSESANANRRRFSRGFMRLYTHSVQTLTAMINAASESVTPLLLEKDVLFFAKLRLHADSLDSSVCGRGASQELSIETAAHISLVEAWLSAFEAALKHSSDDTIKSQIIGFKEDGEDGTKFFETLLTLLACRHATVCTHAAKLLLLIFSDPDIMDNHGEAIASKVLRVLVSLLGAPDLHSSKSALTLISALASVAPSVKLTSGKQEAASNKVVEHASTSFEVMLSLLAAPNRYVKVHGEDVIQEVMQKDTSQLICNNAKCLEPVANLLAEDNGRQQGLGIFILARLSTVPANQFAIAQSGAIQHSMRMLHSEDIQLQGTALVMVAAISACHSIRKVLVKAGAMPPLLFLLGLSTATRHTTVFSAACALKQLLVTAPGRLAVIHNCGIDTFIQIAKLPIRPKPDDDGEQSFEERTASTSLICICLDCLTSLALIAEGRTALLESNGDDKIKEEAQDIADQPQSKTAETAVLQLVFQCCLNESVWKCLSEGDLSELHKDLLNIVEAAVSLARVLVVHSGRARLELLWNGTVMKLQTIVLYCGKRISAGHGGAIAESLCRSALAALVSIASDPRTKPSLSLPFEVQLPAANASSPAEVVTQTSALQHCLEGPNRDVCSFASELISRLAGNTETEETVKPKTVVLRLNLPRSEPVPTAVLLTGTFNNWASLASEGALPLGHIGGNAWDITTCLPPGEHGYRFLIDGMEGSIVDPSNSSRASSTATGQVWSVLRVD